MRRSALRSLLQGLVLSSLPLVTGCPGACPYVPENYNRDLPDGGLSPQPPLGQLLPEAQCATLCGWHDLSSQTGSSRAFDDAGVPVSYIVETSPHQCRLVAGDAGAPVVFCQDFAYPFCTGGRRPAGLMAAPSDERTDSQENVVGAWFAAMAHLEAASIPAFERLARELGDHGAPAHLVAWARRAARDEKRHARSVAQMAKRFGATPPPVRIDPSHVSERRTLAAIAVENEKEGCVGEAWGALVAEWQSHRSTDARLRAALEVIAEDEADHAELAFAVAAWIGEHLDSSERQLVVQARARALDDLRTQVSRPIDATLTEVAGVPDPLCAIALFNGARATIWA